MSVSTIAGQKKEEIIKDYKLHDKDTGSSEVQIALLTKKINHLIEHLKRNKKDNHTRYGLLIQVGRRRRLMRYLQKKNNKSFLELAEKLNLRVSSASAQL